MRKDEYSQFDRDSELYSDFLVDLTTHPVTKDILRLTNENAVKRSIKNLIFTNKYERLYQPTVFSGVSSQLFEQIDNVSGSTLQQIITDAINKHEKRCKLISVNVIGVPDNNLFRIIIQFQLINTSEVSQMEIALYRTR